MSISSKKSAEEAARTNKLTISYRLGFDAV
jgi:hypothetical protein